MALNIKTLSGFGIRPPGDAKVVAWFGARTISSLVEYGGRTSVQFDWVPDRKQMIYETEADETSLAIWLNADAFRTWLNNLCDGPDHNELVGTGKLEFGLDDGRYHAVACARGSAGYCYIGAWLDVAEDAA